MCSTRACVSEFYVRPSRVWDLSRWATDTEAPSTTPCPRDMHTYVKVDRVWNLEGAAKTNFKHTKPNKSLGSVQCKFYIYIHISHIYIYIHSLLYLYKSYILHNICVHIASSCYRGQLQNFSIYKIGFFLPINLVQFTLTHTHTQTLS